LLNTPVSKPRRVISAANWLPKDRHEFESQMSLLPVQTLMHEFMDLFHPQCEHRNGQLKTENASEWKVCFIYTYPIFSPCRCRTKLKISDNAKYASPTDFAGPRPRPREPEGWRTPRRYAPSALTCQRASVLDCGGPPPLSHGVTFAASGVITGNFFLPPVPSGGT
jgi:hypothetical protein